MFKLRDGSRGAVSVGRSVGLVGLSPIRFVDLALNNALALRTSQTTISIFRQHFGSSVACCAARKWKMTSSILHLHKHSRAAERCTVAQDMSAAFQVRGSGS